MLPFEKMNRELLVKKNAETSDKFGCDPDERSTEELVGYGVVNIDKSPGPTSHMVSSYAKEILGVTKSGHSGTLDPRVTGVLPIAIGRATRAVETLLKAGKEYVAVFHLHKEVPKGKVIHTLKEFVGRIRQKPPIKSAVKRQFRFREVYYIDIMEVEEKDLLLRIGCQAGTYIRKLAHDIGVKLDTGCHMAELRRTKAGPFSEANLYTLHDLRDAYHYWKEEGNDLYLRKVIQPVENAVSHIPKVYVFDSTVNSLCHGVNLKIPGISKLESGIEKNDAVAVMTLKGELVCLGKSMMSSDEIMGSVRGIAVKTEKVFMLPRTYPKVEMI